MMRTPAFKMPEALFIIQIYTEGLMHNSTLDKNIHYAIMTVEEVAHYLRKSPSMVYKNWKILGGRKLRGSLVFPSKEDLYELVFGRRERMEVRLHGKGDQVHRSLVQNKNRGQASRSEGKGGDQKSKTKDGGDPNRHGILGTR